MSDYLRVFEYNGEISLTLDAGDERVLAIGQKMEAVCPEAYMNGYNWDAFFSHYLEKNEPDILKDLEADPEGETYAAHWPLTAENTARVRRFEEIIRSLLGNEEELCRIVREEGHEIQWD